MKKYFIFCVILFAASVLILPASAAVIAEFSYSADPSNPLTIRFTDKSIGGPNSWYWTFNDRGAVSREQNPVHTFSDEGEYLVSLVAADASGSEDTAMKFVSVTRGEAAGDADPPSTDGVSLPELSLGGIKIPNPMDLISEYIALIRVMIVPENYQIKNITESENKSVP